MYEDWSQSYLGFMGPAITPIVWLIGIGLIGNEFHFKFFNKQWIFLFLSILFVFVHSFHSHLAYQE
jgi:hypothetical protein